MNPLQQAGNFRGQITSYGLYEPGKDGSKSVAISVVAYVTEAWDADAKEWLDWRDYQLEASGDLWIVKRDGSLLTNQINNIINHTGWDGDFLSVAEMRWHPNMCQFVVNLEKDTTGQYDDKFKIAFINGFDSIPGGGRTFLDAGQAKNLAAKYGAQMRALAGSAAQNSAPPPKSKPVMPTSVVSGSRNTADVNAKLQEAAAETKDEIPF
jgi:hypothetical protein